MIMTYIIEKPEKLKKIIPTLNRVHDYDALTFDSFLQILEIIPTIKNYSKFNLFFHGGILDHPTTTKDLDVKLTRRTKPLTFEEIEYFILDLDTIIRRNFNVFIDIIFLKQIAQYRNPWKPTHEIIDKHDPSVLQALYAPDKRRKPGNKSAIDIKYLYKRKPRKYRVRGKLQIYISAEWAARGHKFNPSFQQLSNQLKAKMYRDPLSTSGRVFNNIQRMAFHQPYRVPYLRNIEIRTVIKSHKKKPLSGFKDFETRFKHQYTEEESTHA